MTIRDPLEMGPENDSPPITPDPNQVTEQPTETPAPAGVSALDEKAFIEDQSYQVAWGSAIGQALARRAGEKAGGKSIRDVRIVDEGVPLTKVEVRKVVDPKPKHFDPEGKTAAEIDADAAAKAQVLRDSDLDDFNTTQSHHINFKTFHTHQDAKAVHAQMADSYKGEINAARRDVQTDAELAKAARELGTDPEFIARGLSRALGQPVNAENILAMRSVLEASARRLKKLAYEISDGADSSDMKMDFLNQFDFHRQWMAQFMGARAELGRGMRAIGVDLNKSGSVKSGNPVIPEGRLEEMINTWGGQVDINKLIKQIKMSDDILSVNAAVRDNKGGMSPYGAALTEYFVGSLLSGIKTQVVNIVGNSIMTIKGPIEVALASRMGVRGATGPDQVLAGEASAMLYGMLYGMRGSFEVAMKAMKSGESYGDVAKFELGRGKAISSEALGVSGPLGSMVDILGVAARAPMERLLGPMDAFFKHMNESAAYAQLSYRRAMELQNSQGLSRDDTLRALDEIMNDPNPQMMGEVIDYGLYATFQNPLGDKGRAVQTAINKFWGVKMLAPFIRTPLNIMKVGFVEGNPLRLLSSQYRKRLFPEQRPDGSYAPGALKIAQTERAKLVMASSVMTLTAAAVYSGNITGSGPKDPQARAQLMATGWRPRSFKVTHDDGSITYVSYARYEPISLMIGTIADIADLMRTQQWDDLDKTTSQQITDALGAIQFALAENTINKTYMKGIHGFMQAFEDFDRFGSRWVSNMSNALIPYAGLRRDLRKGTIPGQTLLDPSGASDKPGIHHWVGGDKYLREANSLVEQLRNQSPWFSTGLPPKLDIWGERVTYDAYNWQWWPSPIVNVKPDAVDQEIQRLALETGKLVVSKPEKKLYGIDLTAQEYHDYMLLSRQAVKLSRSQLWQYPDGSSAPSDEKFYTFKEYLGEVLMKDEEWMAKTDDLKVKDIQKKRAQFDDVAREMLLLSHESLQDRKFKYETVNPMRRQAGDDATREHFATQGVLFDAKFNRVKTQ